MRKIKKTVLSFVLTLCLLMTFPLASNVVLPTDNIGVIEVQAATKTKLNKKKLVLVKGQTETLKVLNTKKNVTWTSSMKTVATVSSKGKVTAKKKGMAVISAKVGGKTYKCNITVETPSISKTKATITIFKTSKLTIKGTKQKVKWKSSNKKVATVDSKGNVKAKKLGKATITATVGDKNRKYTCKVTVADTKKGKEFTKLKNVISKYGYFDSDGDQSLEGSYSFGDGGQDIHNTYILDDTLILVQNTYYSDGGYTYLNVQLQKYSNTVKVYYDCYDSGNKTDEPDDIAITTFNAKYWDNNIVSFDVLQSGFDYDNYYLVDNLANACLRSLMYDTSVLLTDYGISINDLGFSKYNP